MTATPPAPATPPARAVDLLHEMLAIPSPSGQEGRLARFLQAAMRELGFDARRDEVGNVIGDIGQRAGADAPTVMLLSHMDTVDLPLPVRRDSSRLYGRGAVDAKSCLAAMVCAAADSRRFPGTLRVIGAVEEEWLSRGGHHLVRTLPAPDVLIIGEPSGWSTVVLGYKGKLDLEYRVSRDSTHPTAPTEKAAEAASAFWHDLLELLGPGCGHLSFDRPAATLRAMAGDMLEAQLAVDCRLPPGFDLDAFLGALRARARGGELTMVRCVRAVRVARGNPAARCLSAAIRRHGAVPRHKLKTGTSDMNTVAEQWRVPMAAYGPGDSALDHGEDERIEIDEYLRAIAVLTAALDELAPRP
jgi:LysW-gamma-L-lysine carboxypeptidase